MPNMNGTRFRPYIIPLLLSGTVIVISVAVALILQSQIFSINFNRLQTEFRTEAEDIRSRTQASFSEYKSLLTSARGLFEASESVSRDEWQSFVNSLNITKDYPAIEVIEYVQRVQFDDKEIFEKSVQEDTSLLSEGYPNFQIIPKGERTEYYVTQYIEPHFEYIDSLGFDVYTNPKIKSALDLARDTNSVVLSEPLRPFQYQDTPESLLMIIPIYKNDTPQLLLQDRQENLSGYIIAIINPERLLHGVINQTSIKHINFINITDVTQENIIVAERIETSVIAHNNSSDSEVVSLLTINFGTRTYEIEFFSPDKVLISSIERYSPAFAIGIGIIVSILIYIVLLNSIRVKSKAQLLAEDLTKEKSESIDKLEQQNTSLENLKSAMINILDDFNDEKEAQKRALIETQKFYLAVENASDHIIITDPEGTIIYANQAATRTTGFSIEEMLGRKTSDLWGGHMDDNFYQDMWKAIKTEKRAYDGKVKNQKKNGRFYTAEVHIAPVLNLKQEIMFYVGIERDISEQEKINALKDDFLSLASHELRTPMTAIRGITSMILDGDYGDVNENLREPLKEVSSSTEGLINLVNDMLNVSRIEAGRLKFVLSTFDLSNVIKQTCKLLHNLADKKGIELNCSNVQSFAVQADEDKVKQILINILGNALKFTDSGSISLRVELYEEHAIVYIKDTGIGIAPEDGKKLFNKFEQIENKARGKAQGTGLGLYLSIMMAHKMGGNIWLNWSEKGKGSEFGFSVPLENTQAAHSAKTIIENEALEHPDQKM